jgi:hypothetical protein
VDDSPDSKKLMGHTNPNSSEDQEKDFLLTRSRATGVQLIGLLLCGLYLVGVGTVIWIFCVSRVAHSFGLLDVSILLLSSIVCGLLIFLGYLSIKRMFVGRR